ncbi:MAG: EthD family reductase [Solirubrobacterales bacterium]|nr:EthD family reductase [Solirubrobacterales bacterium]
MLAHQIPGLRAFKVNVPLADADAPYDSINELYFDDEEARVAAFASPQGKASGEDAAAHTSQRVHIVTMEHALI